MGGNSVTRKWSLQNVSTKAQRIKVLKWMQVAVLLCGHETHIILDAVKEFPDVFRAPNANANLVKCSRWWKARAHITAAYEHDAKSLSGSFEGNWKWVELKCVRGHGRKPADWVTWLYPIIREDFEKLKSARLKFSPSVLLLVSKNALLTNPHPTFGPHSSLDTDNRSLIDRITPRWIQ